MVPWNEKKLGLFSNEEQDQSLIEQLLKMMEKYKADYTNTFRSLTLDTLENTLYSIVLNLKNGTNFGNLD